MEDTSLREQVRRRRNANAIQNCGATPTGVAENMFSLFIYVCTVCMYVFIYPSIYPCKTTTFSENDTPNIMFYFKDIHIEQSLTQCKPTSSEQNMQYFSHCILMYAATI